MSRLIVNSINALNTDCQVIRTYTCVLSELVDAFLAAPTNILSSNSPMTGVLVAQASRSSLGVVNPVEVVHLRETCDMWCQVTLCRVTHLPEGFHHGWDS